MSLRVFIDSSVLFAAIISSTGHSRDLIRAGLAGQVQLVTSRYVLGEVTANLAAKQPRAAVFLDRIIQEAAWQVLDVDRNDVLEAAGYTALKDAPVVAAARKAGCSHLVTFDRKHLLNPPEVAERSGLAITTPDVIIRLLQEPDE